MTARGWAIEFMVLAGLGVLLALLGPFGTFLMPWPLRLLDWLLFTLGGGLLFRPVIGAARVLARHGAMKLPWAVSCACLLAAFPTTLLVSWCLSGMGWRRVTLEALASLYPQVLLIGALATGLQFAVAARREANRPAPEAPASPAGEPAMVIASPEPVFVAETEPPGTTTPTVAFLSRLPPALGRELLCLENEDHYVRAHTVRGSTLILMRLSDAVAELDGIDGLRTHRSWWVARDAVRGVLRRERSVALQLRNGLEAPVARAMLPVLREAGWLAGAGDPLPRAGAADLDAEG